MVVLLNFIALQIFRTVSIYCVLSRKRQIYTSKNNQYIPFCWAKYELECLLIIFIYFNSKIEVTCKNENFKIPVYQTHSTKWKSLKFVLFHQSPFSFFSHQNSLTNFQSCVVWSLLFLMKPLNASQNDSFQPK